MLVTLGIGALVLAVCLLGTPLFVVMGGSALLNFAHAGVDLQAVVIEFYQLASKPMLQALPLFAFAGCLLARSQAPQRLLRVSNAFLGWLPGGLAIVAVVACALLTAFTGASGMTIVALGGMLLPALTANRYSRGFGLGLLMSAGSIGLLFPPSLPVILYGVVSKASIDDLFRAGLLPGLLLVSVLIAYSFYWGRRHGVPRQAFTGRELMAALWAVKFELPLPVLVIGGVYTGVLAISEAAVVAAAYVMVAEMGIHREVRIRDLGKLAREGVALTGGILMILGMTMAVTNFMIDADVPGQIFAVVSRHVSSRLVFLAALNAFLLVVGCMMDIYAATVLVVPLILPVAAQFGVDPVHLGIIFLSNLAIGYVTPPVGLNLFIGTVQFREPILRLYWVSVPFVLLLLVALLIITYVPWLSLGLL